MRTTRPLLALAAALAVGAPAPLPAAVAGNEVTAHFEQWLDRSGVEARTILGVHSPARTREELRRAGEMMRAGQ